jgi:hypothetical protein
VRALALWLFERCRVLFASTTTSADQYYVGYCWVLPPTCHRRFREEEEEFLVRVLQARRPDLNNRFSMFGSMVKVA